MYVSPVIGLRTLDCPRKYRSNRPTCFIRRLLPAPTASTSNSDSALRNKATSVCVYPVLFDISTTTDW